MMSARNEHIQGILNDSTSLARVLQDLVISYCQGATTLLVADQCHHVIRAVSLADGSVRTIAGQLQRGGHVNGKAAMFHEPSNLAVHLPSNSLLVAEWDGCCVRRVSLDNNSVSTLCGTVEKQGYVEGAGSAAQFTQIGGATVVGSDLFVSDSFNHVIRRIPLDGSASSCFAGSRKSGFVDGKGVEAKFNTPMGLSSDRAGNLFVCDFENHSIRKIDRFGVVTTVAGCGEKGCVDSLAKEARFHNPEGVTVDCCSGDLIVADSGNHMLRRVNLRTGTVSTLEVQPRQDPFEEPHCVVVDEDTGDLYVSCTDNRVRKVSKNGYVSDVCTAEFNYPAGLALWRENLGETASTKKRRRSEGEVKAYKTQKTS